MKFRNLKRFVTKVSLGPRGDAVYDIYIVNNLWHGAAYNRTASHTTILYYMYDNIKLYYCLSGSNASVTKYYANFTVNYYINHNRLIHVTYSKDYKRNNIKTYIRYQYEFHNKIPRLTESGVIRYYHGKGRYSKNWYLDSCNFDKSTFNIDVEIYGITGQGRSAKYNLHRGKVIESSLTVDHRYTVTYKYDENGQVIDYC